MFAMVNEANLSPKFISNQVKCVHHQYQFSIPISNSLPLLRRGIQGAKSYRDSLISNEPCKKYFYWYNITLCNRELIALHCNTELFMCIWEESNTFLRTQTGAACLCKTVGSEECLRVIPALDITRSLPSSQLLEDNGESLGGASACVTDCPLIVCLFVFCLFVFWLDARPLWCIL